MQKSLFKSTSTRHSQHLSLHTLVSAIFSAASNQQDMLFSLQLRVCKTCHCRSLISTISAPQSTVSGDMSYYRVWQKSVRNY